METDVILLIIIACLFATAGLSFLFLKNKRKEIALAVVSTLFALLLAEGIVRRFFPQIMEEYQMFEYDPYLGWGFIPNKRGAIVHPGEAHHYITINAFGFRDGSFLSGRDKKKILVAGDSFVSNISVKDDQVFTEVLERSLKDTEVLNLGVNGYSPVQEYLLLKKWIPDIKPDLVFLFIYVRNDFYENITNEWMMPRPIATWREPGSSLRILPPWPVFSKIRVFPQPVRRFYQKLHLYHFLRKRLETLHRKIFPSTAAEQKPSPYASPERFLCRVKLSPRIKNQYRVMESLLLKISQYAEGQGVPLVFVIAPSFIQIEDQIWASVLREYSEHEEDLDQALPDERLMEFARENNLRMLDLLPVLRREAGKGKSLYYRKEQHWNSEGNRVVARALEEYLKANPLPE